MSQDETSFEEMQASDRRAERRILVGEIALLLAMALATFLYAQLIA